MEPYTFTAAEETVRVEPDGLILSNRDFGWCAAAVRAELLRVVEERDRLKKWNATQADSIRHLRRVHIIGPSPAEVLASEMRMKALEAENARLRAEAETLVSANAELRDGPRGTEVTRQAERATILAYLEHIRDAGAAAMIVAGFRAYSIDTNDHVKVFQALVDAIRDGKHLSGSSS